MSQTLKTASEPTAAPALLQETRGQSAILRLDRPEQRNALSQGLMSELQAALSELGENEQIKAVIIAANGPVYCTGHDLKELTARRADADKGKGFYKEIMAQCSALMLSIVTCPKPIIAAVHGPATAAGCQLVASCDLAVASEAASFCTPGVHIGLFCSTPMIALSRNVSRKHAMEMLLLGDPIEAAEAHRMGLVNKVVGAPELMASAHAIADQIASKSAAILKNWQAGVLQANRYAPCAGLRLCR